MRAIDILISTPFLCLVGLLPLIEVSTGNTVGTACSSNSTCTGPNEYCQSITWLSPPCKTGMCSCLPCYTSGPVDGYLLGAYACTKIKALYLGDACTYNASALQNAYASFFETIMTTNAQCDSSNVVKCRSGYTTSGQVCLHTGTGLEGADCTTDNDCAGEMWCGSTWMCECYYYGTRYDATTGRCLRRSLGDTCNSNSDCYTDCSNWDGFTTSKNVSCDNGACSCGTEKKTTVSYASSSTGQAVTKDICVASGGSVGLSNGSWCTIYPVQWGYDEKLTEVCSSSYVCAYCPEDGASVVDSWMGRCRKLVGQAPTQNCLPAVPTIAPTSTTTTSIAGSNCSCGQNALCSMSGGVKQCSCPTGYHLHSNGQDCYGWITSTVGACSVSCGGNGTQTVTQTCDAPSALGSPCSDSEKIATQICTTGRCPYDEDALKYAVDICFKTSIITVDAFNKTVVPVLQSKVAPAVNTKCKSESDTFKICCPGKTWASGLTGTYVEASGVVVINPFREGDKFCFGFMIQANTTNSLCSAASSAATRKKRVPSYVIAIDQASMMTIAKSTTIVAAINSALQTFDSSASVDSGSVNLATTTTTTTTTTAPSAVKNAGGSSSSGGSSGSSSDSGSMPMTTIIIAAVVPTVAIIIIVVIVVVVIKKKKKSSPKINIAGSNIVDDDDEKSALPRQAWSAMPASHNRNATSQMMPQARGQTAFPGAGGHHRDSITKDNLYSHPQSAVGHVKPIKLDANGTHI